MTALTHKASTFVHSHLTFRYRLPTAPMGLLFITLLISGLISLPLFYLILRASSAGLDKIETFVLQARNFEILGNSLALAAAVTLSSVILGVTLTWLTARTDLPGRKIWSILIVLPLVIPSYIGAFTFVAALGPKGLLQHTLEPYGIERLPSIYGFWGAWLVMTLFTYPYIVLSTRAALRGLDPCMEEAARSLGRNSWQIFSEITLPQLKPALIAGSLLVSLYTLSDFGAVATLRFDTFTRAIYLQYTASFDRSIAAILALQLVIITLVILAGEKYMRGQARYYRSSAGAKRPAKITRLGAWTLPALLLCVTVLLFSLIVPLGVIGYWLWQGWWTNQTMTLSWSLIANSVTASGLAALLASLCALPISILAIRYPTRLSQWLAQSVYVGYALPGTVVALSMVFFGANYVPFLYQTLAMLVFAYLVRFIPEAVGSTRTVLLQLSPRLEEAARSLGRSPFQTFTSITIPLARPGLLTGLALVFLTGMKELPATLLLGPTGFNTLATRVWGATQEAYFAQAAPAALFLVFVSALSVWLILSQEE